MDDPEDEDEAYDETIQVTPWVYPAPKADAGAASTPAVQPTPVVGQKTPVTDEEFEFYVKPTAAKEDVDPETYRAMYDGLEIVKPWRVEDPREKTGTIYGQDHPITDYEFETFLVPDAEQNWADAHGGRAPETDAEEAEAAQWAESLREMFDGDYKSWRPPADEDPDYVAPAETPEEVPEAAEEASPALGTVLSVKEYPGADSSVTFMEQLAGPNGQVVERVRWNVEKRDGAWGVFPPTSQSPAAHVAGTRAAALKWARDPIEEADVPEGWAAYSPPIPAAGEPPLQVGDIVRKGNGKTDWYVTSATKQKVSGAWVYGVSTKPDGQKSGGGYDPAELKIVRRKEVDDGAAPNAGFLPSGPGLLNKPPESIVDKMLLNIEEASDGTVPEAGTPDLEGSSEVADPTPELPGPVVEQAPAGEEAVGLSGVPDFAASLVGPGDKVYTHPQGAVIIVSPDGAVVKVGPNGKPKSTSATAAKLAVGHGQWAPLDVSVPAPTKVPTAPPIDEKPMTDVAPAEAVVVVNKVEPELPSAPAPTGSKPRVPMTFEEVAVVDVAKYAEDDDYYFQQKVDGIRGQLVIEPGKAPWFRSKSGDKLVSSTAAKITGPMLAKLGAQANHGGPSYTVDGELLDGKWYVFDVAVDGQEKTPWEDRMKTAEAWVNEMHKAGITSVQALPTAKTAEQKRALWEKVKESGAEGVMIKRRNAPYDYGKRVNHTVKAKVTSTVDVVVLERNIGGKENARIGLRIGGEEVSIGTVSMQGKEKFGKVNVGDVIEVEYLWAMPGSNALQQPRMIKRRPDKKREDAVGDQLRYVDKSVVDLSAPTAPKAEAPPAPAPTPAPAPAPAPAPKAVEEPSDALGEAVRDFEAPRPNSPSWKIVGDPTSDEWFMKKSSKATLNGEDVIATYMVTRDDNGALVVRDDSGKERPLSGMFPGLWRAATAGKPRSYQDKLDAGLPEYSPLGGWSDAQRTDAQTDMDMPYRPYPPHAYGGKSAPQKELSAYHKAADAWQRELVDRLNKGGPPTVDVRVRTDGTDAEIEAELGRLTKLARAAAVDNELVQDKAAKRSIDSMDNYMSSMSELEVKRINRAAAELRAELLRRVSEQFDTDAGDPDPRWTGTKKPATTPIASAMTADDQRNARNTYVVNDKNTVDKNASLRSGSPSTAAKTWRGKTDRWVKSNVASHDMVTWRGIAVPPEVLRKFQPGATIVDPGVMSTDTSEGNADFYLNARLRTRPDALPVMIEMRVPRGTSIVDADYGEFVLPSGTEMLVRRVYRDGDHIRVVIELGAKPGGSTASVGVGRGARGLAAAELRARIYLT